MSCGPPRARRYTAFLRSLACGQRLETQQRSFATRSIIGSHDSGTANDMRERAKDHYQRLERAKRAGRKPCQGLGQKLVAPHERAMSGDGSPLTSDRPSIRLLGPLPLGSKAGEPHGSEFEIDLRHCVPGSRTCYRRARVVVGLMRPDDHLKAAKDCERLAQTTEEPILRSIYWRMSELHRLLDFEVKRLTDWHRDHPFSDDALRKETKR